MNEMKKATLWILMLLMFRTLSAQTTVNITVKDAYDYSTAVSGATVTLAGVSVVTAGDGLATFIIPTSVVDTYYSYAIKAPGFIDYQTDWLYIAANSSSDEGSAYINRAFSVSFVVVNKNKAAIAGAEIDMADLKDTTDASGHGSFIKKFASGWNPYNFKITAPGYADYSSSVVINNADTFLDTIVLQLAYTIKLTIKDAATSLIENAFVTLADQTDTSAVDGTVTFNKKINGNYAYQISRSGYIDQAGIISVNDKDTSQSIILAAGHDLKLIVINGSIGAVGMPNDTITIGSITKITDNNGIAIFGVDTGNINFTVHKAGFLDSPVSAHITGINDGIIIYMTPFYNVYFSVLDEFSSLPLSGVHVNLNGNTAVTDENGLVSFLNLAPSDSLYSYTLTSDSGYNKVTGTISLANSSSYVDQFNIVNVSLTMNKPGITFYLAYNMMVYISPATINLNGVDYIYDTGIESVHIEIAPGTYPYIITPADPSKAILKGQITVGDSGNDSQGFDLSDGYKVEIYAADIHSNPIEGATVIFAGDTLLTDASGDAIFMRKPAGDFSYSISMTGFKDITAKNLSVVTSDVLEIATMNLIGYHVAFHISDGTNAIENATVDFNSESFNTDVTGLVGFDGLIAGSFDYTVTKDGFLVDQGTIIISDTDVNKEIVLVVNAVRNFNLSEIRIYPNPATDKLSISLGNSENKDVIINIIDLSGRTVKTASFANAGAEIEMSIYDLNPGSYLMKVQAGSEIHLLKLIKK